jgi:hypothetical protein
MAPIRIFKTSSSRRGREEINIINNAELRVNAQNILAIIYKAQFKNINKVYKSKQKEFKIN